MLSQLHPHLLYVCQELLHTNVHLMKGVREGRPGQGAEEAAAGKRALQRGACQAPVTPTGLLVSPTLSTLSPLYFTNGF